MVPVQDCSVLSVEGLFWFVKLVVAVVMVAEQVVVVLTEMRIKQLIIEV